MLDTAASFFVGSSFYFKLVTHIEVRNCVGPCQHASISRIERHPRLDQVPHGKRHKGKGGRQRLAFHLPRAP